MVARLVTALAVLMAASSDPAVAQEDGVYSLGGPRLAVSDPAPALAVQEYVRGRPVAQFEPGTVYVVEFWKVGCPPCRAAIPYLTNLQKTYPATIFLSVGVYTPTAENVAYAARAGSQMVGRVAVDRVPPGKDPTTEGAMVQTWLEPAGEDGVPTTFLVDAHGRIAWVGHPLQLDEPASARPLHQVVAGMWDLKKAAAEFAATRTTDARKRIAQLPRADADAVRSLQARVGRVQVEIRGNAVVGVQLDPRSVSDRVIADAAIDLRKLTSLRRLNLCGGDISNVALQSLRDLAALTDFDISSTRVTDAALAHLRGWTDLSVLSLQHTQVTGAGLKDLSPLPNLTTLNLSGLPLTAVGLRSLKKLPELRVLNLSGTHLTDELLGELTGTTGLRGLNLSDTQVTDSGLKALTGMTLGHLSLTNTRVEGPGLKNLRDLVGGLNLSGTPFTDGGVAELKRFPGLRRLVLDRTRVTDAALAALRENRDLLSLSLTDTRVSDAGLLSLRAMHGLEVLELGGTGVTNAGLRELERFRSLTFLDVARTQVSKAAIDRLQTAQPALQIAY